MTVMWILLAQAGMNIYLAAPVAVCFAVLIGVANGLLVSKGKVPGVHRHLRYAEYRQQHRAGADAGIVYLFFAPCVPERL